MTIHKEGYKTIALASLVFGVLNILSFYLLSFSLPWISYLIFALTLGLLLFIISFFRVPKRIFSLNDKHIIAPADGKVVVIEEVTDTEYFNERRIQVSIFMSPANVHQNRNPASGKVVYNQYHKGAYLVAWNPKSSTENERHSVVIEHAPGKQVLVKQIAGAVARRIVNYLKTGETVTQCSEMGFIKFGSRVDLLLPLNTKIEVAINQTVKGGVTVIGRW
jgi:phosphatidylserine decarboxylase